MTHKYTLELTAGMTDEMSEHDQYEQLRINIGKWTKPQGIDMYVDSDVVKMIYSEKTVVMGTNRAIFNYAVHSFVRWSLRAEASAKLDEFFYKMDRMRGKNASFIGMDTPMRKEDGYPYYSMFMETAPREFPLLYLESYILKRAAEFGLEEGAIFVEETPTFHTSYSCRISTQPTKNGLSENDLVLEMNYPSVEFTDYMLRTLDNYMRYIAGFPEEIKQAQ